MSRLSPLPLLALLAACGGGGSSVNPLPPPPSPSPWYAGPTIAGRNYSPGTTLVDTPDGVVVNVPLQGQGETDAVLRAGTVNGAKSIHLKYKVETDSTVEPKEYPAYTQASVALFFQREGDDWSCAGDHEAYRWYATGYRQDLHAGTYTMDVPLDDGWTGCQTSTIANNPQGFADAKAGSNVVGLALGGGTGVMHGVVSLGTYTRITILEWSVQ